MARILRVTEPRQLIIVLEKENLDRILAGDPFDFDTTTYFHGHKIAVSIGYAEECPSDPQEAVKHITRSFHTTATDHQKPVLIPKGKHGRN